MVYGSVMFNSLLVLTRVFFTVSIKCSKNSSSKLGKDYLLICTTLVISGSWLLYSMHTGNCNWHLCEFEHKHVLNTNTGRKQSLVRQSVATDNHLSDADFLWKTQWKLTWCTLKNSMESGRTHKNLVRNLGMSTISRKVTLFRSTGFVSGKPWKGI